MSDGDPFVFASVEDESGYEGKGEIAFLLPAFLSVTTAAVRETLFLGVILVYERRRRSSSFAWCTWAPMFFWVYTYLSKLKQNSYYIQYDD